MLVLRTFGGLSLENGGRPLVGAAGQPRRLALLAVLAVAGDAGLTRDRLCALLWPESDTERARGALKQTLYALRRDVQDPDLIIGATELRLNPDVITSDVADFTSALSKGELEKAAARYRGPFLDGVHLRSASEFERWADTQRQTLALRYADALEKLVGAAMGRRDAAAAVDWARQLSVADALNTRAALLFIHALDAAGDRAGAIRQGELHAALLRRELEVEPSPELTQTLARLREMPASVAASPGAASPDAASPDAASPGATSPGEGSGVMTVVTAERPPILTRWRRQAMSIAAVVLAVAGVAAAVIIRQRASTQPEVVVVLPFENNTGDSTYDVVGRMAADWITQGLRETSLVDVIDSRTAFTSGGPDTGAHLSAEGAVAVANRTGATMIVRGAIYRDKDTLTLHAEIVRSSDARVLAALGPMTAPINDPRRVVEGARQRVLGAFAAFGDARFAAWRNAVSEPPRYDAYQEFILGLADMGARRESAFGHFMAAARMDTGFVQAKLYAIETLGLDSTEPTPGLQDSLLRASMGQRERLTAYDRAALDRRVAHSRSDAETMLLHSRRMVTMAPHSSDAHVWHALDALQTNRFRESLAELHRERSTGGGANTLSVPGTAGEAGFFERIDPLAHHLAGDYDEELADARAWSAAKPNDFERCLAMARPLAALGRESIVDSTIARCVALPRGSLGSAYLGVGREYRAHRHDAEAERALLRARENFQLMGPGRPVAHAADFASGDWTQVRENWRDTVALRAAGVVGYGQLGIALAHLGNQDGALKMEQAIERQAIVGAQRLLWMAMIEEALGNRRQALALIQEAVSKGVAPAMMLHTHSATGFAPLRDDPTFQVWLRARP